MFLGLKASARKIWGWDLNSECCILSRDRAGRRLRQLGGWPSQGAVCNGRGVRGGQRLSGLAADPGLRAYPQREESTVIIFVEHLLHMVLFSR